MPSPMEEKMRAMLAQNARGGKPDLEEERGIKGKGKGSADELYSKGGGKGSSDGNLEDPGDKGKGKGKGKGKDKADFAGEGSVVPSGAETFDLANRDPGVVFQRKSRNAGMHTIEVYTPQFYFSQLEMEEYDARPDRFGPTVIGKYTKGVGQVEARFPTDDEDPISFAMTVVHRLIERMEAKGINETGSYQPDGIPLNIWNAIGRLDIGTESITDRSKSMKSFVMDIFERYANESNIEGVDQYNACYGGQAAGLCTQAWIESDRWDGRYGIAVATDISEAHPMGMAFVGAATTAALFFPDAPLPHHSQRASCVMHRFDFCKPVGWHDIAPITDGKYSVECYLDALDVCYATLRQKLNGRGPLEVTDYNVFHTGGGYHVVRKAFERMCRAEYKNLKPAERDELNQSKLAPSVSLLKIIGPCHTVSSFLNTASVCMNTMEKALGKVILVFTYGSGCAASLYQMRVDDVPFFDTLEVWKLQFYRNAIKLKPWESHIHNFYVETWMKFDYIPHGRRTGKISVWSYEDDVYYLMQIDKFGRRFYHRGGLATGPLDDSLRLPVDKAEERPQREHFGPILQRPQPKAKLEDSKEERFREIEYAMAFGEEVESSKYEALAEHTDRYNPNLKVTIRRPIAQKAIRVEPDGQSHTYQIVGTWSSRQPEDMPSAMSGGWFFELTLGENRWESFYLIQDGDPEKRIYPSQPRASCSSAEVVTVGPHSGGPKHEWLLDCRTRVNVPEEQVGMPGDKYRVTFRWDTLKDLTWEKLKGEKGEVAPGQYYISGSWTHWEFVELQPDNTGLRRRKQGWYSTEAQMTSLGLEFKVVRNKDPSQSIYPQAPPPSTGLAVTQHSPICGPDDGESGLWKIEDSPGTVYRISFFRDPADCESMRIDWKKVEDRPLGAEPEPAFFLVGPYNDWGANGATRMHRVDDGIFAGEVPIQELAADPNMPLTKQPLMPFRILMHKMRSRCIHPDQDQCSQLSEHKVLMDENKDNFSWHIGRHPSDKAQKGDSFSVRLQVAKDGSHVVTWSKQN